MLPSEALVRGSSLDFKIMAIATAYQNHIHNKENNIAQEPTKDKLQVMLDRAKKIQKERSCQK